MSIMNAVAPIKARAENSASLSRQQNPKEPSHPSASGSGLEFSENHTHFESFLPQPPKDLPVLPETTLEIPNQDTLVGSDFQTLLSSTTPISPPVPSSRVTPVPIQESQGNEPEKLPDSTSHENTPRLRQDAQHSSGKTHALILPSHLIETTTENHRVVRTDGPSHAQQTPSGTSVPQAPSTPIRYPADASTTPISPPIPISRGTPVPTQESQGNGPEKLPDSASHENTPRPRQEAQHSSGKTHAPILPSQLIETTTENHRVVRTDGPSHAHQTPSGTSVPQAPSTPIRYPADASTTPRPRQDAQHSSGKTHAPILPSQLIETTTENHRVVRTVGPSHAQQTPSGTSVPQAPSTPIRYPADASTQHAADPLPKKDSAIQSPTPTANPAGQDGNIRQELLSRTYPFNNETKQEQQQQSPETQQNRPNRQIREQEKGPGIPPAQHPSNGLTTSTDKGAQTNMDRHPKPLNQPRIQSSPRQAASGSAPLQGQPTGPSNRFFLDQRALDPSTVSASAPQPSGLDPSVELSPSRTAPGSMSRLGQIEQIQSIVKEHAIILRRFNQDSLTAEIRPDGKTSITLSLHANSDGITVTAQMDAKNADWLKGNWPALQSRLADQNIFLEDPKDRQSTSGQQSDPGDSRQASHRPHNSRGATNDKQQPSEQQSNSKTNPTESTELSSERVYWA